jgi:DNA-binding transcriptional LysR family regulator
MARSSINDLVAFLAVAQDQSFTRAAAKLGVTPSALSHAIKGLEERLGLRLLSRTTRNVSPTAAGERLMRSIAPHFEQIEAEIASLSELRDKPAGTIRIACSDYVIDTIFRPTLKEFLPKYPDINVELAIDNGFTNIVEQRFDADTSGPYEPCLYQYATGERWRTLCVGVRQRWTGIICSG